MLADRTRQQLTNLLKKRLEKFNINQEINESFLKKYVQQFYIHSAHDLRAKSNFPIESFIQLGDDREDVNNTIVFYYILGFEFLRIIFQMSWLQHERLYGLQKNQEAFIQSYIKPIQNTHKLNGIIVPRNESIFFAKRSYFIKKPKIRDKKLTELVMATFTVDTVTNLGFLMIRHLNFIVFDYDYIFSSEPESFFLL